MRSKVLTGAAAFTLATIAGLVSAAPASAHDAQWSPTGNVVTDIPAGIVAGAFAAATLPFWATGYDYYGGADYPGHYGGYYPGYVYEPGFVYEPGYSYAPAYGFYAPYGSRQWRYRGGPHPR